MTLGRQELLANNPHGMLNVCCRLCYSVAIMYLFYVTGMGR